MKNKKFLLPAVFLAVTIIAYIIATVAFCYTTKPEIATGEFPFSITYKYKDEINTLSGVCKFEFSGSRTIHGQHERFWEQEVTYNNPGNTHIIEEDDELMTTLAIQPDMYAGYFMGDPLEKDYYQRYGHDGVEPYVEYYDYKNEIYLDDENREEVLESIGFEIIECSYAEPIENSFSFSGIKYKADNITIFVAIMLIFLLACIIFVRKDKEYRYTYLDKSCIIVNFIVGIIALPFIYIVCSLFGIVGSGYEWIDQIIYNIPPIAILCLALSIVFRRKGFSKTGFFIQFGGVALFILSIFSDLL